jgi:hypothetical protein
MSLPSSPRGLKSSLPKKGTVRDESVKTEKRLSKELGARTQPNSGAGYRKNSKGDLTDDDFLYEVKETEKATLRLGFDVVEKIHFEARSIGKIPVLVMVVKSMDASVPREWVMLPKQDFVEMKESFVSCRFLLSTI